MNALKIVFLINILKIIYLNMNRKQLYESIMTSVTKEVKKALNEFNRYENCDHHHAGNVKDLMFLRDVLRNNYSYIANHLSADAQKDKSYNLIVRRKDGQRRQVFVQQRKKGTTSGNILLLNKKYGEPISKLENPQIDEICVVCPPIMNFDPNGQVVDNTKACFFDKEFIIEAIKRGDIKVKLTRDGENIVIPEKWAKENAKEIITYKYKK